MAPRRGRALVVGLVLAAAGALAIAAGGARPATGGKPLKTVPAKEGLQKKWGEAGKDEATKVLEAPEKTEASAKDQDVDRLRGLVALNGGSRSGYEERAAIDAFRSGLVTLGDAEALGFNQRFVSEWDTLFRSLERRPNAEELKPLIDRAFQRAREAEQRQRELRELEWRQKVAQAEVRARPLDAATVAALQSSSKDRRAVLDPAMPDVVVKLADDPVHDKAILGHVWFRHAVALADAVSRDKLHVLNLFPDPVGDSLVRQIEAMLGEKTPPQRNASRLLHDMLTGLRNYEQDSLVQALSLVQGETIYIVSHIPASTPGTGHLEYRGKSVIATDIAQLHRAFKAARVNLFIVGCSSALHTPTGLSQEIYNTDALAGFKQALGASDTRSLFGWHAAFAGGAKVVVDPLATEIFGKDVVAGDASKVTLEKDGAPVSTGYVATFGPPQHSAGGVGPSTVPEAVALGRMSVPMGAGFCRGHPTAAQIEAGNRWMNLASAALLFVYVVACHAFLQMEFHKPRGERKEWVVAMLMPLAIGAPIVFCWFQWITGDRGQLDPGPFLPLWCLAYGALCFAIWKSEGKDRDVRFLLAAIPLAVAGILYGLTYLGWGANGELQNFCEAGRRSY